jgi:RNA recognition motif-containing protein
MVNVPHDYSESQLSDWVMSRGVGVKSVRLIRDLVAGVSPSFAYVDITDDANIARAIDELNGRTLGNRVLMVSQARRPLAKSA